MNNKQYGKFLTIILIIVTIGIVGLLVFLGYQIINRYSINKQTSMGIESFVSEIENDHLQKNVISDNVIDEILNSVSSTEIPVIPDINQESNQVNNQTTKKYYYEDYQMVGYIEIPKTKIKYPILSKATKSALDKAVAILYPEDTVLNQPGNVVIAGHNYKNGLFFSNNKKLVEGDLIYITDTSNEKRTYKIYKVFETTSDDTSFYTRDTEGKAEITLSTCSNSGGNGRLIIQASV